MRAFVERQRHQALALGERGQMRGLLRFAAGKRQRAGADQRGGEERAGGQRAARRLHHLAQAEAAERGAAIGFRHENAGPAELGHLPPQRQGEAQRILVIAQLAQRADRRALGEEIERGVADQRGVAVEGERHGLSPAGQAHAWR